MLKFALHRMLLAAAVAFCAASTTPAFAKARWDVKPVERPLPAMVAIPIADLPLPDADPLASGDPDPNPLPAQLAPKSGPARSVAVSRILQASMLPAEDIPADWITPVAACLAVAAAVYSAGEWVRRRKAIG